MNTLQTKDGLDIFFLKSNKKTVIIDDEFTEYQTDILHYTINENIFKGSNVKVITNTNKIETEKDGLIAVFFFFK